jgi:hypothetical protein
MTQTEDPDSKAKEKAHDVVYDATKDAIIGARRALIVVTGLIGLGFFHLYNWYGSWELARIQARHAVALSTLDNPTSLKMEHEADDIDRAWRLREYRLPILNLSVPRSDFSVGLLMAAVAALLWLYFYQRRINFCLDGLMSESGWHLPITIIRFHFVLIDSPGKTKFEHVMKYTVYGLFLALPVLSFMFVLSDFYDLHRYFSQADWTVAFYYNEFSARAAFRLGLGLTLTTATTLAGGACLKEFRETQSKFLTTK